MDDSLVTHTLGVIRRQAGLVFDNVRLRSTVETIGRWVADRRITSAEQITPGPILDALLEQIVVHESYFDRDLDQLSMIDELVFAARQARADTLRVWSAGCAGGEEPYTLAFLLQTRHMLARTAITATDLSRLALERARAGRYRAWSLRTGAETPAMRYLERDGTDLCVPAVIRHAVEFRALNLTEDAYPVHQDLIVCRNVLIYLEPAAVAKVAAKLADALAPDGWLFVAPSDPRLDDHAPLEITVTERGVFYRRAERVIAQPPPSPPPPAARVTAAPPIQQVARATVAPRPPAPVRKVESARASQLADRGDYAGARRVLADSLATSPLDAELHFLSAVLAADDDIPAALAALARATYLAPEIPASYLFAGRLHQSTGNRKAARRAYHSALRLLEAIPPDAPVPWSDEPARLLAAVCRHALEALGDR